MEVTFIIGRSPKPKKARGHAFGRRSFLLKKGAKKELQQSP